MFGSAEDQATILRLKIKDNSKPSMALHEAYENASDLLEETYKGSGIILGAVRRDV